MTQSRNDRDDVGGDAGADRRTTIDAVEIEARRSRVSQRLLSTAADGAGGCGSLTLVMFTVSRSRLRAVSS